MKVLKKGNKLYEYNNIPKIELPLEPEVIQDLSDIEFVNMINAHSNGQIKLQDYWAVGDTKSISINYEKIPSDIVNSSVQGTGSDKIIILDFEHDYYDYGSKLSAISLGISMNINSSGQALYLFKSAIAKDITSYNDSPVRLFLKNNFPEVIENHLIVENINTISKKTLKVSSTNGVDKETNQTYNNIEFLGYEDINDKFTLLSSVEFHGNNAKFAAVRYSASDPYTTNKCLEELRTIGVQYKLFINKDIAENKKIIGSTGSLFREIRNNQFNVPTSSLVEENGERIYPVGKIGDLPMPLCQMFPIFCMGQSKKK